MSDINPKLSLRSGVIAAEKSTSPSTKLMLNHGKPNFTINRSKSKTDSQCPFSPSNPEAASVVLKSTANGYVMPSVMKIPLTGENEVNKVVLRRTKLPEENAKPVQQGEEPEFVKAQRKIAERLASQNNLDFESRKSGYFTHVMISPSSPTKQMELPVVADHKIEKALVVEVVSESIDPVEEQPIKITTESIKSKDEAEKNEEGAKKCDAESKKETDMEKPTQNGHESGDSSQLNGSANEEKTAGVAEAAKAIVEELVQSAEKEISGTVNEVSKPIQNGNENGAGNCIRNGNENNVTNGDFKVENHTQKIDHASQGEVNFEPKTVTSFAKELSSEPNKYPDTVKVVTEVQPTEQDELLKDMYKLKFDIHADSEDIKVIPTVRPTE